ncbi:MAG: cytochrome b N-terminal domain-containing protein [Patescibacteria group bacterium]|nr:cytochrome b N-terminal domain-containing protein [Patescibacteria group bacterium]
MLENRENVSRWGALKNIMIPEVPSYGNKIFYSLGFLALACFLILAASGLVMVFSGPSWWLTTSAGLFFRSLHLWAAQAFILIIILHLLVVFLTSAFKGKRKLTWVLGSLMFILALFEAEFGYGLRGDFSSQWRTLQAADLYNGTGLGLFINNLNYAQIYGIHIVFIPFIIFTLLGFHYFLVRVLGIAKPYRADIKYEMVPANHAALFLRGFALVAVLIILALTFPSPTVLPTTIQDVAQSDPSLVAQTLMGEMTRTSDTANYLDSIDPYAFDTRSVYITVPYTQYLQTFGGVNLLQTFNDENSGLQKQNLQTASAYFNGSDKTITGTQANPVIGVINALTNMAKSGLYQAALQGESTNWLNKTYTDRFIADTGIIDAKAEKLRMTTEQYGMIREENSSLLPPGAWWLAPLGLMDNTILANDPNQDRDGAEILGMLILLLVLFPYIPYVNRLPEKLGAAKLIWK